MRYFDLDDAWFPKDFGALELPGSDDDIDAILNVRDFTHPIHDAIEIQSAPGFPGFVEWVTSVAVDSTGDPDESVPQRTINMMNFMIAMFVFGYQWRQIVERRRVAERN